MATALGSADLIWLIILGYVWHVALSQEGVKNLSSLLSHWKMDRMFEVTWNASINVTACCMKHPKGCKSGTVTKTKCLFVPESIHNGAKMIILMGNKNKNYSEIIPLPPKGMPGTVAENFSCVVYNVSSMNCTWNYGRNAPDDTQYFLYLTYKEEERECPYYIDNTSRRHVACHFPNMTVDENEVYFLVNGSSKDSLIQIYDTLLLLYKFERLNPPQNITVNCSELSSQCKVDWKPPRYSREPAYVHFKYQIKDEIRNSCTTTENNFVHSTQTKNILRIRACGSMGVITRTCGEWSKPIEFGTNHNHLPVILIFAAVGTILMIGLLVFLCERYHLWQKLTYPVPQPKDILQQCMDTEKIWEDTVAPENETENKITLVEDMT